MAKVLQLGENPNINGGNPAGPFTSIPRIYRVALYSTVRDGIQSQVSPLSKFNQMDALPSAGQRWPRRMERT
jgi:hypothetical protein